MYCLMKNPKTPAIQNQIIDNYIIFNALFEKIAGKGFLKLILKVLLLLIFWFATELL